MNGDQKTLDTQALAIAARVEGAQTELGRRLDDHVAQDARAQEHTAANLAAIRQELQTDRTETRASMTRIHGRIEETAAVLTGKIDQWGKAANTWRWKAVYAVMGLLVALSGYLLTMGVPWQ